MMNRPAATATDRTSHPHNPNIITVATAITTHVPTAAPTTANVAESATRLKPKRSTNTLRIFSLTTNLFLLILLVTPQGIEPQVAGQFR